MTKEIHTSNTAQAFWIGIGSLSSFLFSIISAAVLSRYFAKSDYGTYKQVMYVYSTLLSVFTLGLPLAYSYFLPRVGLEEGKALVSKLNVCFIVLGFAFSALLYFGSGVIANILNNQDLVLTLKIFSPAPIFLLPTMGLQGILATYKKTIWNALYTILSSSFLLICVAVPVVFYQADVKIAIWGFSIASFLSCVVAFFFMNIPFRGVKREKCKTSYKEIFNYSVPLMIAGLLGVAISAADQFYVSRFFGKEVFADFANGSLELPFVGMVLTAGSTVLLPVFSKMISENDRKEEIIELWERTAVKASYILYPMVVFCIFFATDIMVFLYGTVYSTSAVYFRIMLLANFFTVVQFYPIILALGKTKSYALIHVLVLLLVWGLEFAAVQIFQTAVSVTIISVVCKVIKMMLMMRIVADAIHVRFIALFPLRELLFTVISCMVSGLLAYIVVRLLPFDTNHLFNLIIGFMVFVLSVFCSGKIMHIDYLSVIRPLTEKLFNRR